MITEVTLEGDDSNTEDLEVNVVDESDPLLEIGINPQEMESIV